MTAVASVRRELRAAVAAEIAAQPARNPSKKPITGQAASGAGVRRSHAAVITPSVPSDPIRRRLRS